MRLFPVVMGSNLRPVNQLLTLGHIILLVYYEAWLRLKSELPVFMSYLGRDEARELWTLVLIEHFLLLLDLELQLIEL